MNHHVRILRKAIRLVWGHRTITIRGEGAVPLQFPPSEYPRLLMGIRAFEPEIKNRWKPLVSPGEVIFDVGANIGLTVQRFNALLSGNCDIYAFEPLPRNLTLLRQNISGVKSKVRVIATAVSNEIGRTTFEDNLNHGALSRISGRTGPTSTDDREFWKNTNFVEVDLVTLDQFCVDHSEAAPTFVKLDVEGAGHLVMQGAKNVLKLHKPVVSCSFHSDEETNGIIKVLEAHGYRGIHIHADGTLSWCSLKETTEFGHPDSERISKRIAASR